MNTDDDFFYKKNYVKVNNTDLSPEETAKRIVETFRFEMVEED